jgi:hypothetical protein
MDRVGCAKVPPSGWRNPFDASGVPPKVPPYYSVAQWRNLGGTCSEVAERREVPPRFRQPIAGVVPPPPIEGGGGDPNNPTRLWAARLAHITHRVGGDINAESR